MLYEVIAVFIGRQKELSLMETLAASGKFEFLVLYGRRRVGKTRLLQEFISKHPGIFFSAEEKNDPLNLADFSRTVQTYFDGHAYSVFTGWEDAFRYVGDHAADPLTLIIDEFPFIASENPSVKSILQHMIDHDWCNKPVFLILCGSSISFMKNEIMGYKSPLYGRSTSQMEVLPFDYYESAAFFPNYSAIDKLLVYGILGGIPCYLQRFSDQLTIEQNIAAQILETGSFLKDEPQLLLRMELREPSVYNSVFGAIAGGSSRQNEISQKIHEDSTKCNKYISTLRAIRLLDRITPCGEDETSRKSVYKITDNYFAFWYRYIFANKTYYELLGSTDAAADIIGDLSNYMGTIFENICLQYLYRLARMHKLPFIPRYIGRWWGNNPKLHRQDDIDILALDNNHHPENVIFCECKFRNELFDMSEYNKFMEGQGQLFPEPQKRYYYIFSKSGFTNAVAAQAKKDSVTLVKPENLFEAGL